MARISSVRLRKRAPLRKSGPCSVVRRALRCTARLLGIRFAVRSPPITRVARVQTLMLAVRLCSHYRQQQAGASLGEALWRLTLGPHFSIAVMKGRASLLMIARVII